MRTLSKLAALLSLPLLAACGSGDGADALVKRGKVVFETNCTACHARDPRLDGPVGPAND